MRNTLPRFLLSALLFSVSAHNSQAEDQAKKPNVLFIIVDDLRPELGCYGKDYIHSPNIDRIASNGVVFDRAYVQQAVCSPTRSSLLTGTRPDTTKVWDLKTHFRKAIPDVVTLLQNFKNNGYFVQGMGKVFHGGFNDQGSWSVPWVNPKSQVYALPENNELNSHKPAGEPDGDGESKKAIPGEKEPYAAGEIAPNRLRTRGPAFECADVPDNTYTDGKVCDLALEAMRKLAAKKEPFFLAVGFVKPHLPFVSPKKYWDLYDPATIKLAPNPFRPKDAPEYSIIPGDELRMYHAIPDGHLPDDLARTLKHAYYAAISYTDAQVGKLLDELKTLGLEKDTIVIILGDHGWKLGEHDAWAKHSNVENDVNAPLIISVPGMKNAGHHTKSLVEFVDIYPTLSELAGLSLPSHLEGVSTKPLLENLNLPWKSAAFSQYPRSHEATHGVDLMGYSMRTDRYRFTVWVHEDDHSKVDAIELYDETTDPQENTNVAKDPANADIVKNLMAQWQKGWQGNKPPTTSTSTPAS
ncbi:MAG: sulfatase [Verrucomicrobiota bacterium]